MSVNYVHPVTSPLPEEIIRDVCLERCFIMKLVITQLHSQADIMLKNYDEILKNLKAFFDRPVNTYEICTRLDNSQKSFSTIFEVPESEVV